MTNYIIKLTPQINGLNYVDINHKQVNHNYAIQNNCSACFTDEAIKKVSKEHGRYECRAWLNASNRKKPVLVSIGFDKDGKYQTSSINYGRGRFPQEVQDELYSTLFKWMIDDGWLGIFESNHLFF